jgi:hypothetical protein
MIYFLSEFLKLPCAPTVNLGWTSNEIPATLTGFGQSYGTWIGENKWIIIGWLNISKFFPDSFQISGMAHLIYWKLAHIPICQNKVKFQGKAIDR